jgi:putrescine---pyruvate transaminase
MLDCIERDDFVSQARDKGQLLLEALKQALVGHPHVGEVRGLGLMCGIEYVKNKATKEEFAPEEKVGSRIHAAAQERGLFSRLRGDVFCLAPPVVISPAQIERIASIMKDATEAVLSRG